MNSVAVAVVVESGATVLKKLPAKTARLVRGLKTLEESEEVYMPVAEVVTGNVNAGRSVVPVEPMRLLRVEVEFRVVVSSAR